MITLSNTEIDGSIDSISGQIEFLILYDRIESLIKFYNCSQNNYEDYIKDKKKELKDFENKIQNQKHRTFKDEDLGELTFTEEEMTMTIKDELYGIEKYFLEFQKMTFITLCYSEVEKFFDNIIDITIGKNIKLKNLKQKILRLSNYLRVDLTELISRVDTLRRIRNNIVHNYDYWDSEIIIVGEETQIEINDLENLNDEILSNILNLIIESIIEFEIEYNKKTTIIIN